VTPHSSMSVLDMTLSCLLENGDDGKFHVIHTLSQLVCVSVCVCVCVCVSGDQTQGLMHAGKHSGTELHLQPSTVFFKCRTV
jgi:hypothetical protein